MTNNFNMILLLISIIVVFLAGICYLEFKKIKIELDKHKETLTIYKEKIDLLLNLNEKIIENKLNDEYIPSPPTTYDINTLPVNNDMNVELNNDENIQMVDAHIDDSIELVEIDDNIVDDTVVDDNIVDDTVVDDEDDNIVDDTVIDDKDDTVVDDKDDTVVDDNIVDDEDDNIVDDKDDTVVDDKDDTVVDDNINTDIVETDTNVVADEDFTINISNDIDNMSIDNMSIDNISIDNISIDNISIDNSENDITEVYNNEKKVIYDEYVKKSVKELRDILTEKGLHLSGNKTKLVNRILDNM